MGILDQLSSGAIEGVLNGVGSLAKDVRAAITGDLSQEQKAELKKKAKELEGQAQQAQAELKSAQRDIIVAEAKGESWLQRNWRPGIMTIFGLIVFNNYVLNPYITAFGGADVMLELPPQMWQLLKIGIGGYIVGRSAEKGIGIYKGKREN